MNTELTYPPLHLQLVMGNLRKFWRSMVVSDEEKMKIHDIDEAAMGCGYTHANYGGSRDFLLSAKLFGLIEYNHREHTFSFNSPAIAILNDPMDLDFLRKTAFTPPLFAKLNERFEGSLDVYRPMVRTVLKESALTHADVNDAATAYSKTIQYLRELLPVNLSAPEVIMCSEDGKIILQYPKGIKLMNVISIVQAKLENVKEEEKKRISTEEADEEKWRHENQ